MSVRVSAVRCPVSGRPRIRFSRAGPYNPAMGCRWPSKNSSSPSRRMSTRLICCQGRNMTVRNRRIHTPLRPAVTCHMPRRQPTQVANRDAQNRKIQSPGEGRAVSAAAGRTTSQRNWAHHRRARTRPPQPACQLGGAAGCAVSRASTSSRCSRIRCRCLCALCAASVCTSCTRRDRGRSLDASGAGRSGPPTRLPGTPRGTVHGLRPSPTVLRSALEAAGTCRGPAPPKGACGSAGRRPESPDAPAGGMKWASRARKDCRNLAMSDAGSVWERLCVGGRRTKEGPA